jgi:hypothetical protein
VIVGNPGDIADMARRGFGMLFDNLRDVSGLKSVPHCSGSPTAIPVFPEANTRDACQGLSGRRKRRSAARGDPAGYSGPGAGSKFGGVTLFLR